MQRISQEILPKKKEHKAMPDYKALYFALFRASVDATEALRKAQQEAEELFLQQQECPPLLLVQKKQPPLQGEGPFDMNFNSLDE